MSAVDEVMECLGLCGWDCACHCKCYLYDPTWQHKDNMFQVMRVLGPVDQDKAASIRALYCTEVNDDDRGGVLWVSPHASLATAADWNTRGRGHDPRPGDLYIWSVRVDEAHQGQGHGKVLMQALCDYADAADIGLSLSVFQSNEPAVRLYHSVGFTITNGTESGIYYMRREARS